MKRLFNRSADDASMMPWTMVLLREVAGFGLDIPERYVAPAARNFIRVKRYFTSKSAPYGPKHYGEY